MTSPHQVEWPFKDGEGRQTARTVLYLLKAFSKAFWNNETHVFIEFLRTFGIFPKEQADRKRVPLLNKGCGKRRLGHRNKSFHRIFKNAAQCHEAVSCFVVLIGSVLRYKCDCTGSPYAQA
jgi:hypothetical protein